VPAAGAATTREGRQRAAARVCIPVRVFFIPGNQESGNFIPGRPGM